MVIGMELGFSGNSLIKVGGHTGEVLKLRFIFLLDFFVHFLSFTLEVLDVGHEAVADRSLELFVVVDVLDDPVDCVFEGTDDDLVSLNLDAGLLDHSLHMLLTLS